MEGMKNISEDDLSALTPHEVEVLRMLCGIDMAARSTKEVALYFAMTADAVEEVKTAALRKLRQPILTLI
jgi:DNA-directed RNA polymerase sigma subunit (sigma70/sigma32)